MTGTIGIDPGLASGAIAYLEDGRPVEWMTLPRLSKKDHLDWRAIAEWIEERPKIDLAVLEKVSSRPGEGVRSVFNFGGAFHGLHATLQILGVPYELSTPRRWKKSVLAGLDTSEKSSSVAYVRRRWPSVDLRPTPRSRKDSDNIADAICIAAFAASQLTPIP